MIKAPPTPKGFRDILPELATKRRKTINEIVEVLEKYEFVPIETPIIEFAETLTGKYGEEERLIYKFQDRGGRNLALRYDLTVPLARFIATHSSLPMPFRRYQIGSVFRGENPQHGRYREFTQFDFDSVGFSECGLDEDAKVIACALEATRKLGLKKALMVINDRNNFTGMPQDFIRAIDKLYKIGEDGVKKELTEKGHTEKDIKTYFKKIEDLKIQIEEEVNKSHPSMEMFKLAFILRDKYGLKYGPDFVYDPTLARGLDYYTGTIYELKPTGKMDELTIGSGGRYDNLIGAFAKRQIPAVGFSFGLDRLIDCLP
ncbi:histidine--tRNA ligase [Candidatus Curtissbacteria bacterium]|nr:histidine--tRNA ligase [Candidatus Curtissbacteria bacterium]